MTDMDNGRYAEAYALLEDLDRRDQSYSAFAERVRQFNAQAGEVRERRIVTLTWTKDPARAPLPGVYVAIDLVSRFANIDRHCGFLVLYQESSGAPFQVMREENNFLDNAAAAKIAKQSTSAGVETMWSKLSAHCPGYQAASDLTAQSALAVPSAPLPEQKTSTIGYPTVDAALTGLHSKAGVVFTNEQGWTIADDAAAKTIWSFPPPGHPAYPSAVKRQIVEQAGAVSIEMAVSCEASKKACDDLVRSFEQLNDQIRENIHRRQ